MSKDDPRRAALSRAVNTCRRALVGDRKSNEAGDLEVQLEAPFGFDRTTGVPRPMAEMSHLRSWQRPAAEMLRQWHGHLCPGAAGETEAERARSAYDQMKYELGYTVLHRLCALRMAEERDVVQECVRKGRDSAGFRVFLQLAGDSGLGTHEDVYAFFLARLYDELSRDLPAVFDRRSAASLITPGPKALATVITAISAPNIATLWEEDETLGWIFEDYNDADERKEMREHDAPRNARELAVRNQFFTPRWVVEFLTDNTLGRLWYDLTGGKTQLAEACRFLLKPSERPVAGCRDPRDLKSLDPACGSGHFLLYVYDLLTIIYREAWAGRHHQSPGYTPLWEEYPDEDAFHREIPRLILAHNLYGVDIDPRCIQEAGLALWLRAHRSWKELGLRAKDRPRIAHVNLVCTQVLPSTPELKEKLRAKLKPAVLGKLVDTLFLRVAEMGLLLRVDTAIQGTVEAVKKEYVLWKKDSAQRNLFGELIGSRQTTLEDFASLQKEGQDEAFWKEADQLLLEALDALGEEADDKDHFTNRLFAEGVRDEVEFFDLSRIKFDVILMNPPFGEPSESTKEFLDAAYPNAGHDLYAMFYERTLELLAAGGRVGAITSRSWLALPTLVKFRQEVIAKKGTVEVAADLGYGVLNAKVETTAAVVRAGGDLDRPATWIRLVKTGRKVETLLQALATGPAHPAVSVVAVRHFESLPSMVCGYWMSGDLARSYGRPETVGTVADVKQGTATADDFRFLRLAWEVQTQALGLANTWARFAKGGEYRQFFDDVNLVIRWAGGGQEVDAFIGAYIRNARFYGERGATWPLRNQKFGPRALPAGCAFGHKGPSAFATVDVLPRLLAVLASRPVSLFLAIRVGIADNDPKAISPAFEVGLVRDLPWPSLTDVQSRRLGALSTEAVESVRLGQIEDDSSGETVQAFAVPPSLLPLVDGVRPTSLSQATYARVAAREDRLVRLTAIQSEIDDIVATAYGFSPRDREVMDEELEPSIAALPGSDPIDEEQFRAAYLTKAELDGSKLPGGKDAEMDVRTEHRRKKQVRLRDETTLCRIFQSSPSRVAELRRKLGLLRKEDLQHSAADIVSYAVGIAFGRWDIRLWAHPQWIATFADPFDPMPACPLGHLVNAEGVPATERRLASEEWLAARKHPTNLPPGRDVTAQEYPLSVAWNGVIEDDTLDDELPRPPRESLAARLESVFEQLFGANRSDWENDIAEALGADRIAEWLRAPAGFFDDHLGRYSKSRRQAPIYWPLSTASGGLVFWVYAPRFDAETLPLLVNRLRVSVDSLSDRRDRLSNEQGSDAARLEALSRLSREIKERGELRTQLQEVIDWGYKPTADDGFVITASPLHFAFRLAKWRDILKASWDGLNAGKCDWAHLAMIRRPSEVLVKCAADRSLAIAHGQEALCAALEGKKTKRAMKSTDGTTTKPKKAATKQLPLLGGTKGDGA